MENSKTSIEWQEKSKSIKLKCSDKLWEYLQKLRGKDIKDLDFLTLMGVWKEIKSLDLNLDKEKKNAKV